jgi:choline dehydrogenase-like flavoprotein
MAEGYDFIIIGGGSSGCVLANRLTADAGGARPAAGGGRQGQSPADPHARGLCQDDHRPPHLGAGHGAAETREQPRDSLCAGAGDRRRLLNQRRGVHPRQPRRLRPLGQAEGCEGWAFKDIQKYFLRSEGNTFLAGDWHGTEGELGVSNLPGPQPMTRAFVQACQQRGIPYNPDFNGAVQEGSGVYQTTTKNGKRCSAAVGYLRPAMKRSNLTVKTGCMVHRIVIENGRAVGVDYAQGGQRTTARATSEVLLTSGAIGSPRLMMLSGLGPAAHLREHGIEVMADLPGVGENLHDHFGIDIVAELNGHQSLDKYNKLHWMIWAGAQYYLFGSGPVTSNVVEGGAFWYADQSQPVPDLQFHFLAGAGAEAGVPSVPKGSSGITLNSYTLRPKSRGTVRLRSSDPTALPIVDPNFLSHPDDLKTSVEGVKISREIFEQAALQKHIRKIRFPDDSVKTRAEYEAYARQYGRTSYHPTCTCKMGADSDPMAVVDPQLRVRGIDGLRICDSSVMPSLVGSNTNAPTIMIGEKAADLVRGNR